MAIEIVTKYEVEICISEKCGVQFAVTQEFQLARERDHKYFYCPNGHGQKYTVKSDIEMLKEELKKKDAFILNRDNKISNLIQEKAQIKNSRAAYKAHLTRLRNRRNNSNG